MSGPMTDEPPAALKRTEIRAIYDQLGVKQDDQGWYEDKALQNLLRNADFAGADCIVEVGCGTGRFAEMLFKTYLGPNARFVGVDISRTMVDLARARLRPWGDRVEVQLTDGGFELPKADVVIATYVLELMSEDDIADLLAAAHRALQPDGQLCLASLTSRRGSLNYLWSLLYRVLPRRLGGCRPLNLAGHLQRHWRVTHHTFVSSYGLASEALIARPRA